MAKASRGGWPYANPPNGAFELNRMSPQARGLVAWYPAISGSKGNVLRDRVRKNHSSPFTNTPEWRGYDTVGWGLFTNGVDERVSLGTYVLTVCQSHVFSVSCWMRVPPGEADEYYAFSASQDIAAKQHYSIAIIEATYIVFYFRGGGNTWITWGGAAITADTWFHVVAVSAATDDRALYVDGILRGTSAVSTTPTGLNRAAIGAIRRSSAWDYKAAGSMADLRIYDRPLGAAEAWNLYANRWELYRPITQSRGVLQSTTPAVAATVQRIRLGGGGGIRVA